MSITTQVLRTREGGNVRRCHTVPWIGHYDVAQHTFGMLMLLDLLYQKPDPLGGASYNYVELQQYILWHDVHERWTGDVPAGLRFFKPDIRKTFKLAEKEVQEKFEFPMLELDPEEKDWIRALDQLEFLLSCYDQKALGNQNVDQYIRDVEEWFVDNENVPKPVATFVRNFKWERTNQRTEEGQKLAY